MKVIFDRISLKKGSYFLFCNLSFELHAGEIIEVVGANGCGKTSFLKMVAGYSVPSHGSVFLPWHEKPLYLSLLSGFDEALTGYENLQYLLTLERRKDKNLMDILARIGINPPKNRDRPFQKFSAGEKQRINLTRLLLLERRLWLLDEPMASLDQEGERIFKEICQEHLKQDGRILIASPKPLSMGRVVWLEDYAKPCENLSESWETL